MYRMESNRKHSLQREGKHNDVLQNSNQGGRKSSEFTDYQQLFLQ